jgi:TusA-related sulfurtransferase
MTHFVDVDVRPTLRAGNEPFGQIMAAVNALAPGQGLRLYATFKPTPLLHVLGSRGFTHEAREIEGGDWEVLFTPGGPADTTADAPAADGGGEWPSPVRHLDNRDLDPPEPMVRILAALENMAPGEVLSALLCREPVFLFPQLAKRGHVWRGGFEPDGATYKVLVRVGQREAA